MSLTRTDLAPEIPTFKEQGYNIELSSLRGIAAPKGLPAMCASVWSARSPRPPPTPSSSRSRWAFSPRCATALAPAQYTTVLREAETGVPQALGPNCPGATSKGKAAGALPVCRPLKKGADLPIKFH